MVDFESGKLFVGGIPRDTTTATLTDYFSRYGEVLSSTIAKDRTTGNPRGFAFVAFTDPSSALKALDDNHEISGRTVEVKKAKPRSVQQFHQSHRENSISTANSNFDSQFRTRKIFVGGLSANVTEDDFRSYFEKFGRILDVVVMYDNVTNRPRGFGFITFDSEDVVDRITSNSFHVLGGKYVEVKRAVPKESSRNVSNGQNSGSGTGWAASPYMVSNANLGFHPSHGHGGVYGGGGYQMPWPGYGPVGYRMPMVAARYPWNGFGMVGYGHGPGHGHGPGSVYPMNLGPGGGLGSFAVPNGAGDDSLDTGKLVYHGGNNYDVQGNGSVRSSYNGSSTSKTSKGGVSYKNQRQRSFDRKQKPLSSAD